MRTVLHLIPTLEGGGAERQLSLLAVEQVKRGFDVHVAIRREGVHSSPIESHGVALHKLGDHRGINPVLLHNICRLARRLRPSVIHAWLPQMVLLGGVAAQLMSIPWVFAERASGLVFRRRGVETAALYGLSRFANAIVTNSASAAAYWRQTLGSNARVHQIANAVDVFAIHNSQSIGRREIGSDDTKFELLVVGRLAPEKAVEVVIEAVRRLPIGFPVHVTILGDGAMREPLRALIEGLNLGDQIGLWPYRSDWWGLLKWAGALVSMSRHEGQPNVVLEAIAARCPLIVSDIPAHREFLSDETAIFVPLDSPDALRDAIISVVEDPASARERAARAVPVIQALTIQAAADAYEAVYDRAIEG